ncbi:FAB1 (YFR019W) [Zygosaccharomyces parabailii]|nr:FAB1 (YFR019W) [Zygosaccharomyces parabailii]
MSGASSDMMSLKQKGPAATVKAAPDKPEFLATQALIPKTTTDLDTNPVLSNISLPQELSNSGSIPLEDTHSDSTANKSRSSGVSTSGLDLEPHTFTHNNHHSGALSPLSKYGRGKSGRSLTFSINNDANIKRSSIYESKSTVTAIPIRNPVTGGKQHHGDNDDASSSKSASSSMTKSFLFGFYDNKKKHENATKGVLSKQYWMKDDSAKECFTCGRAFTTFRRRHHCRICGQIFCSGCTLLISGDRFGYNGKMRVCKNCFEHADNYEDSSDDDSYGEQNSHHNNNNSAIQETSPDKWSSPSAALSPGLGLANHNPVMKQQDLFLMNDEDVKSIVTTAEDTKLFLSTPPPPPKMAIPATRQGESLEISFPTYRHSNALDSQQHESAGSSGTGVRDRFTIKDVDMLSPYDLQFGSPSQMHGRSSNKNSKKSLRKTVFNYVNNGKHSSERPDSGGSADSIIGNLGSKNFKFEFNYMKSARRSSIESSKKDSGLWLSHAPNDRDETSSSVLLQDDDTSEDEASMSIYSSLNDPMHSRNPIRSMRNSTKSVQRAEASLQRMRFRRKSKSKPTKDSDSIFKGLNIFTHSTPNLVSVVNEDNAFGSQTNTSTNSLAKPKNKSGNAGQWRRISSVSGLRVPREKRNELNEVARLHLKALLDQVIRDQNFETLDFWTPLLKDFLHKVQNIELSARDSNTLDFRQNYVKIKRISGGSIAASEYINGLVFSKALPCKNMPRFLENPRILLIMFPLEYQRNENHFLSIETVFAQEKEYLDKLVSRLVSLSPDIIFVGANVSGYALELLNKLGVVVQFNLKPQIMERIAKLTDADIAISVDKLAANVKMGECEEFKVKTYIYGNISKTYTILRGCNPSLGGTILLRGDSQEVLRKVKDVTEFMVYALFSLKLESSFFNDNFLQLSTSYYVNERKRRREQKYLGYFSAFLEKFNNRILTVSPTVEFPVPFLLERARELEQELLNKKKENELLLARGSMEDDPRIESLGLASKLTQKDLKYLIKFVHEKEMEDLELQFRKRSRHWELSYAQSHNLLGTGSHQCITVLYSMVSTKTATPCIGPQLVTIDYFWDSDISVGQFIENVIATASYPCRQGCGGLLIDHYRSYVHGRGKVDVLIEKFQTRLPKLKDIILTWSYCKKCGTSTPILQMSEKTWNYSFGKYLEVMFWSNNEGVTGIGNCTHDFTKEHVKYFGYNDLVARMEYSALEVHELVTPPRRITWTPYKDIKMKVELYYQILDKINSFYDSVSDRLGRVKLDSMSGDKLAAAQEKLDELKLRVNEEKKTVLDDLEQLYHESPGDQHIKLNVVIKAVHDKVVSWDAEFTEFGKKFLPSENDITRITSNQLKKLFSDFNKSQETKKTGPQAQNKSLEIEDLRFNQQENGKEEERAKSLQQPLGPKNTEETVFDGSKKKKGYHSLSRLNSRQIDPPDNSTSQANQNPLSRPALRKTSSSINSSLDNSTAENVRRSSLNSNFSGDSFFAKEHNTKSKVGELASFFDQMHFDALSKEFEMQRERERIQLNKNKYQASRLHQSTPIVEIYKNVKDAVDEPLHDQSKRASKEGLPNSESHEKISTRASNQNQIDKKLESQLENSIHQWGEKIFHKGGGKKDKVDPEFATNAILNGGKEAITAAAAPPALTIANANKDDANTQPEKSLLMKALTNFWADRSASLWKPLNYPTHPTEHIFVDSDVIIREDEPSSLIAFCLSTSDYRLKMAKLDNQQPTTFARTETHQSSQTPEASFSETESQQSGETLKNNAHKYASMEKDSSITPDDTQAQPQNFQPMPRSENEILESIMTKKTAVHLRYQFEDSLSVMSCKIFFAEHFDAFRRICGCNDRFIQSLSRCVKWDSSGGKSGSGFLKTLDGRFIIKELSHAELDAFIKFAPSYFEYMAQAMFHDLPTALAKAFGFYQIQVKSSISGSKNYKMDVIIMENLFYEKNPTRIFDLKGSMRNRHVEQTGKQNQVLLDENMVEYIYESPIHVREYDKKLLRASLWNDTLFLAKINVMDYSLVVGIDNKGHTLAVGIIDFIRTFTWDKKLENWVKEKSIVGGNSIKKPTVVTPKQYKNRFREAMERYILMVPDPWYQENT